MIMAKIFSRLHHIALRPTAENFDRAIHFYTKVLGAQIDREWIMGETKCAMIYIGSGIMIEIFGDGSRDAGVGAIPHFALETDDVAESLRICREMGYSECTPGGLPTDSSIEDFVMIEDPFYAMKIGFILGPCGEVIEFVKELR